MEDFNFDKAVEKYYQPVENNMNSQDIKRHVISALLTFGSVVLFVVAAELANPSFAFTKEALLTLGVSAGVTGIRAVAKLVLEWYNQ